MLQLLIDVKTDVENCCLTLSNLEANVSSSIITCMS